MLGEQERQKCRRGSLKFIYFAKKFYFHANRSRFPNVCVVTVPRTEIFLHEMLPKREENIDLHNLMNALSLTQVGGLKGTRNDIKWEQRSNNRAIILHGLFVAIDAVLWAYKTFMIATNAQKQKILFSSQAIA